MHIKQLALNRYVIEQIIKGNKPSISRNEKVDLDYLATYWNNIISTVEKEIGEKPVSVRLVIEKE